MSTVECAAHRDVGVCSVSVARLLQCCLEQVDRGDVADHLGGGAAVLLRGVGAGAAVVFPLWAVRQQTLLTHLVFGLGLYLSVMILSAVCG